MSAFSTFLSGDEGVTIIEGQVCAGAVLFLPHLVIKATLRSTVASLANSRMTKLSCLGVRGKLASGAGGFWGGKSVLPRFT